MGDMKECFDALREYNKERREEKTAKYEPMLIKAGARFMTYGVYRIGDWDFYPAKGYCRNVKTNQKTSIDKKLKELGK